MKNMFNIYYINNEKASEISMLFDNQIVEKITRIKNTELALAGDVDATTGAASKIPVIGQYLPSVDLNGNLSHNRSNRVEDTVKVVSSKSTILKKSNLLRCTLSSNVNIANKFEICCITKLMKSLILRAFLKSKKTPFKILLTLISLVLMIF